jgi:DNA polymerase III delta subunit
MPRLVVAAGDPLQGEEAALAWLPPALAYTRRDGSELSADLLFADLGQPGMFAEERALLYTDVLAAKLNKRDSERVAALLARLPAGTHLACVQVIQEETKSKSDTKFKSAGLRLFADGAELRDLRPLAEGAGAVQWLGQRAQERYGLRLGPPQLTRILALSDSSPALADGELQKLALLLGGSGAPAGGSSSPATGQGPAPLAAVPDAVLDSLLSGSPAAKFYELVDTLLADPPGSQAALAAWFDAEGETFRLVFELRRRLLQARSAARGEAVYPPFAARGAQALARRLGGARLGGALEALAALEHGLKRGAYPGESSRLAELGALQVFAADLARALRG